MPTRSLGQADQDDAASRSRVSMGAFDARLRGTEDAIQSLGARFEQLSMRHDNQFDNLSNKLTAQIAAMAPKSPNWIGLGAMLFTGVGLIITIGAQALGPTSTLAQATAADVKAILSTRFSHDDAMAMKSEFQHSVERVTDQGVTRSDLAQDDKRVDDRYAAEHEQRLAATTRIDKAMDGINTNFSETVKRFEDEIAEIRRARAAKE